MGKVLLRVSRARRTARRGREATPEQGAFPCSRNLRPERFLAAAWHPLTLEVLKSQGSRCPLVCRFLMSISHLDLVDIAICVHGRAGHLDLRRIHAGIGQTRSRGWKSCGFIYQLLHTLVLYLVYDIYLRILVKAISTLSIPHGIYSDSMQRSRYTTSSYFDYYLECYFQVLFECSLTARSTAIVVVMLL